MWKYLGGRQHLGEFPWVIHLLEQLAVALNRSNNENKYCMAKCTLKCKIPWLCCTAGWCMDQECAQDTGWSGAEGFSQFLLLPLGAFLNRQARASMQGHRLPYLLTSPDTSKTGNSNSSKLQNFRKFPLNLYFKSFSIFPHGLSNTTCRLPTDYFLILLWAPSEREFLKDS